MNISGNPLVSGNDILKLIPQRAPMVMVDALISSNKRKVETRFHIKEDNIFCINQRFREPGLIENIAQTAAAGFGYDYWRDGKEIPFGYIGALRKLKIFDLPEVESEINTVITVEHEVLGMTVVFGQVFLNKIKMMECEMKVIIQKKEV